MDRVFGRNDIAQKVIGQMSVYEVRNQTEITSSSSTHEKLALHHGKPSSRVANAPPLPSLVTPLHWTKVFSVVGLNDSPPPYEIPPGKYLWWMQNLKYPGY